MGVASGASLARWCALTSALGRPALAVSRAHPVAPHLMAPLLPSAQGQTHLSARLRSLRGLTSAPCQAHLVALPLVLPQLLPSAQGQAHLSTRLQRLRLTSAPCRAHLVALLWSLQELTSAAALLLLLLAHPAAAACCSWHSSSPCHQRSGSAEGHCMGCGTACAECDVTMGCFGSGYSFVKLVS